MAGLLANGSAVLLSFPNGQIKSGSSVDNEQNLATIQSRGRLDYGPPNWVGPLHSLLIPGLGPFREPFVTKSVIRFDR